MRKGKGQIRKANIPAWTIYYKWCEVVLNYGRLNLLQGTEHENSLNDSNAQELQTLDFSVQWRKSCSWCNTTYFFKQPQYKEFSEENNGQNMWITLGEKWKVLDLTLYYNGTLPSLDNNLVIKYGKMKCQGQYNTLGTFHKKNMIIALNVEY